MTTKILSSLLQTQPQQSWIPVSILSAGNSATTVLNSSLHTFANPLRSQRQRLRSILRLCSISHCVHSRRHYCPFRFHPIPAVFGQVPAALKRLTSIPYDLPFFFNDLYLNAIFWRGFDNWCKFTFLWGCWGVRVLRFSYVQICFDLHASCIQSLHMVETAK